MSRIKNIFTKAALGAGIALTSLTAPGCAALVPGAVTATVGNNNPFTGMISADDAYRLAQTEVVDASLGEDQKKIVHVIRQLQKTSLGREMTGRTGIRRTIIRTM